MLPNPQSREVTIIDYINILRKRITLILAFVIIIPLCVTIFVFITKPVYRATVSVLIEKSAPKVTKIEEVAAASGQSYFRDVQYYQTQYKVLASRSLAERVVEDLRLSADPDFRNTKNIVEVIKDKVKIEPVRNSQIVLINAEDTDAFRAAAIANAWAKAYISMDIESRGRVTKEAAGWLEAQLGSLKNRLQEAEVALNKYIQENKIVATPDIEKRTETLLGSLKKEKAERESDIAEASKRYKAKHPKMISLNAQIEEVNKRIEQETNNLLLLNQKMVQYNILKKEVESNQQLYISILSRAKETVVSGKLGTSSISIVDSANPPKNPIRPQKQKSILLSIFLSLFCSVSIAFFLEYLDSSIKTAEDVSTYLNLPFLGYIPSVEKDVKLAKDRNLVVYKSPKSIITESFRAVRTSVLFAAPEDKPLKSVLITSSVPQEGKTFISTNISCIFSQVNERIILLDVDMRRPQLHNVFPNTSKLGLSDFLTGNCTLEDIIKPSPVTNLSFITAGTIPPNPSELLSSAKTGLLLAELKSRFDRVILDSPPILSAADTSLLANLVDGVILVIKGASTRLEVVTQSKQKILEAKGKIIGVIVNNIIPEKEDRYYYYSYYYDKEEGQKKKTA